MYFPKPDGQTDIRTDIIIYRAASLLINMLVHYTDLQSNLLFYLTIFVISNSIHLYTT